MDAVKAANMGDKKAMFQVGLCYENGIDVKEDREEAFSWYLKAAKAGYAAAMGKVGYMYMEGIYADDDPVLGLKWVEKGISLKDPYCIYTLGKCYEEGTGLDEDINKALQWYEKAAEFGSIDAMNELGMLYYEGGYFDKDVDNAIMWYKKAADLGDTEAMKKLASLYSDEDKEEESVAWYKKAAEKGDTEAMISLGLHFGYSQPDQAIIWFRKAAELGNAEGCYFLGDFYQGGLAVEKDVSKAIYWYKKALEINPDKEVAKRSLEKLGIPTEKLIESYRAKKVAEKRVEAYMPIIAKIRNGYVDPMRSRLSANVYVYKHKQNIASPDGKPCWQNDMIKLSFSTNNTMIEEDAIVVNLIAPGGGDGKAIYEKKQQPKRINYILVDGIIYTWQNNDYSDVKPSLRYDGAKGMVTDLDGSREYRPTR